MLGGEQNGAGRGLLASVHIYFRGGSEEAARWRRPAVPADTQVLPLVPHDLPPVHRRVTADLDGGERDACRAALVRTAEGRVILFIH